MNLENKAQIRLLEAEIPRDKIKAFADAGYRKACDRMIRELQACLRDVKPENEVLKGTLRIFLAKVVQIKARIDE